MHLVTSLHIQDFVGDNGVPVCMIFFQKNNVIHISNEVWWIRNLERTAPQSVF